MRAAALLFDFITSDQNMASKKLYVDGWISSSPHPCRKRRDLLSLSAAKCGGSPMKRRLSGTFYLNFTSICLSFFTHRCSQSHFSQLKMFSNASKVTFFSLSSSRDQNQAFLSGPGNITSSWLQFENRESQSSALIRYILLELQESSRF